MLLFMKYFNSNLLSLFKIINALDHVDTASLFKI